jgi:NADPH:quinone reductase-like Zn-dependent oxidoreductase
MITAGLSSPRPVLADPDLQTGEGRRCLKAAVIHQYGPPRVLRYEDYPDAVAGPGEVLIRTAAAGVNPVDAFERKGLTKKWRPIVFPGVIGWDISGTVASLGPSVNGFAVGDPVFAWAYHTYAELCAVQVDVLVRVPEGLDLVHAAALPLVTLTGSQLISIASGVKYGQTVLVSGALGGVGRSAIFTARQLGGVVIAGVRRSQLEDARSLGANEVVAIDDEQALAGLAPVDVVANTVRGDTAARLLLTVKPGGTFASVTGPPDNVKDVPSVRVVPFVSKQNTAGLVALGRAAAAGQLVVPIDRRLPLKDAAAAHEILEKGTSGKVLLVP